MIRILVSWEILTSNLTMLYQLQRLYIVPASALRAREVLNLSAHFQSSWFIGIWLTETGRRTNWTVTCIFWCGGGMRWRRARCCTFWRCGYQTDKLTTKVRFSDDIKLFPDVKLLIKKKESD